MENKNENPVGSFRFFMRIFRGWKNARDWFGATLGVDVPRKIEIYTQLSTSATVRDLVYWLQILFSAGIATLGLVLNSSAVIIGAMLISPLMAPILSQGLSLATGDLTLGVRSIVNLFLSTVLGVTFALVLVALLPFKDITPEIIARTKPNTLDLVIALFSGAIGSIATCKEVKGVVTSIPGVAIAVALMPPLCVMGFGLGYAVSLWDARGLEIAKGGGLLYLTNLVAITFTAMLVFVALRIDRQKVREAVRKWRDTDLESQWWLSQINKIPRLEQAREVRSFSLRLLMILLPLLIIFFPLSTSFSNLRTEIIQKQEENKVNLAARNIWKTYELDSEGNVRSYLDELKISEIEGRLTVYLRVFDNKPYTNGERRRYINLLASELGRKPETISLQLVEIPTSEREEIQPAVETTPTPVTIAQRQAGLRQSVSDALINFRLPSPASLIDYNVTTHSNGRESLHIYYLSSRDIEPDGKSALLEIVRTRLRLPNIILAFTRISSDSQTIPFIPRKSEITEDGKDDLDSVARYLDTHPTLKIRIRLNSSENEQLSESRKRTLRSFFVEIHSIAEDRLVFDGTDDKDLIETYQLYIRK